MTGNEAAVYERTTNSKHSTALCFRHSFSVTLRLWQVATTSAFVGTRCFRCLSEAKQISRIEQRPWGGDNCTLGCSEIPVTDPHIAHANPHTYFHTICFLLSSHLNLLSLLSHALLNGLPNKILCAFFISYKRIVWGHLSLLIQSP